MARSAGRRFNDSIMHYFEDLSDFSFFQESRFMKILLLSSVLDLRHTSGGRFNPAIPQVHFVLPSCQFSLFSIALFEFILINSTCSFDVDLDCGGWFKFCSIDPRSSYPGKGTAKLTSKWSYFPIMIAVTKYFPLFYISSCVHARVTLQIIACAS